MVLNRSLISIVLLASLMATAGCFGGGPVSTSAPTNESPTATAAGSPVGTGDLPYDLRLRNYDKSTTTMNVTVTYTETGERIFAKEVTLDPDENTDFDLSFREAGNYTVNATVNGMTDEYVWKLESTPPSHELIVTTEDGDVLFLRSSA